MKIIGSEKFEGFCKKHADVESALNKWILEVSQAEWKNHSELKNSFASADYVGNGRYVFNIKGNRYRTVVVVIFLAEAVIIRYIGTHRDYDKIDAKTI